MAHSEVANESDRRIGLYLFDEINRVDAEIRRLNERRGVLKQIQSLMFVCLRCTGGGTICVGRTADDTPDYQPCPECGGKGHRR